MHLGVDRAPEMHISSDLLHADAKQRTLALKAVTKINRKLNFDTVDLIKRETSLSQNSGRSKCQTEFTPLILFPLVIPCLVISQNFCSPLIGTNMSL